MTASSWHPHTIHTYYLGFTFPEERIGAYVYLRCQPAFGMCGGGVVIHRGTDNLLTLDAEYSDYEATMAWPQVDGWTITTPTGLEREPHPRGEAIPERHERPQARCPRALTREAHTPRGAAAAHTPRGERHEAGAPTGGHRASSCTSPARSR